MTIDLTPFCDPDREPINRPIYIDGMAYATNSRIFVCAPTEIADSQGPGLNWVKKARRKFPHPARIRVRTIKPCTLLASDLPALEFMPCPVCHGTKQDETGCRGCECGNCAGARTKEACLYCNATGRVERSPQPVRAGNVWFARQDLALLCATLGDGVEIFPDNQNRFAFFCIGDIYGLLTPCRGPRG